VRLGWFVSFFLDLSLEGKNWGRRGRERGTGATHSASGFVVFISGLGLSRLKAVIRL
jgi:hypothetical protein